MHRLLRILQSPAHWCGLALATLVLLLHNLGLTQWGGLGLALLGYAVAYGVGGLWFGFAHGNGNPWDALEFQDEGDARTSMGEALGAVRQLLRYNPDNRLPANLQTQALALTDQLSALLDQWERSKGHLSLEESFHARHIALSYLPDALKTYLSIPKEFAASKKLANGMTAQDIFRGTLDELELKVRQLTDDLAAQDAQAFLNHSQFLKEKFKHPERLGSGQSADSGAQ
jgi:hypothetical protein